MMIESVVPAIAIASVRPIAAATTRKKSGDRSGGKRPWRKVPIEAMVPEAKSAEGRISAARQQRTNTATEAKKVARRRSVRLKRGRHLRQSLARAVSLTVGFMLCFAPLAQPRPLRRGVASIERIERLAVHALRRLIEDHTPVAQCDNSREIA